MLYLDDVSAVVSLQNVSIDEEIEEQTPNTIISSNYPNPFNPETTISFTIPESEIVTLDVYNVRGQLIKSLLNSHHNPGTHSVMWKGNDTDNRAVPSGVYFYKLQAGSYTETKKMVLLK
jgi:flagellar hook assembly protein FlgD